MAFATLMCFLVLLKAGQVFWGLSQIPYIYTNTFIIKVRPTEDIQDILKLQPELKIEKEIIPRVYLLKKDIEGCVPCNLTYLSDLEHRLKDKYSNCSWFRLPSFSSSLFKVEYVEQAKRYFKPIDDSNGHLREKSKLYGNTDTHVRTKRSLKALQAPIYGMGIPEAWEKGSNGKGVVIGITDVGVVTDIPDLRNKTNFVLSKSFVLDEWGLEPTDFPSYPEDVFRDHGNNCAGLIVGILNNTECTVGVAHEAKIAVLKIFSFAMGRMEIDEAHMVKALVHELDRIHILSNSWSTQIDHHFQPLPRSLTDIIEYGTLTGRHGKGRIHVFPPGGLADGFANSPYTITISAVGTGGKKTKYTPECACVLTTAYGEGQSNSSDKCITTSYNDGNCTDRFKGTSPATAIIAGVIALLLQENDHLTWRDVQYLIIQSSSMDGIQDTKGFVKNAAGRFYHGSYGYGLINATKLVSEVKRIPKLTEQVVYTSQDNDFVAQESEINKSTWKLHIERPCDTKRNKCMTSIEQVIVKTNFTTDSEKETELILKSPSQTKSYLMRPGQSYKTATHRRNAELLSVHFWGERADGDWSLQLRKTTNSKGTVSIQGFVITLYGSTGKISDVRSKDKKDVIQIDTDVNSKDNHRIENNRRVPPQYTIQQALPFTTFITAVFLLIFYIYCKLIKRV